MKYNFLRSYCKLNLFLDIGKKEKKTNLHNIQSLVHIINLFDEIRIKKIIGKKDKINFIGSFSNHVKKNDNSILKSLYMLRKSGYLPYNQSYFLEVKKKIPAFSGMGGGSSNSAAIIKHFLKGKKISEKEINYFSRILGSDLKLFFVSSQMFQENLRSIKIIKSKHRFYFIVVYPFLKCSTKEVYSKVNSYNQIRKKNFNFNSKKNLIALLKKKRNLLEKIVIKKYPIIKKILNEIQKTNNCQFSRLTGSGSACFGLFLTQKSAVSAHIKIKKKFPNYWCATGKTI